MVVTRTTTWVDGNTLTAAALNGEFNNLLNAPAIQNADIAGGAGIVYSKLSLTGSIVNADISSGAAIAYSKLNLASSIQNSDLAGGIAYSNINFGGNIKDADISNSAGIQASKISDTAITQTATQTLSNKTLTKPTLNASVQGTNSYSPGIAGTATLTLATANVHTVNMPAGNVTVAVSNASVGQVFVARIVQDIVGSRLVTWFSTIKWPGGSAPTLTTTANKIDVVAFLCTSTGNFDGYIVGQNL